MMKYKGQIAKLCSHTVHGSHLVYFGAAAFGAHDIYAIMAGVIFVVMIIGYSCGANLGE